MKKNKNEMKKRQDKARAKVKQKRQAFLGKMNRKIYERPAISRLEPPQGFIAVSSNQALMEYAKPLMETDPENLDQLNLKMEMASSLWNLAISVQKDEKREHAHWLEKAKNSVRKVMKLEGEEADRYIEMMVERQTRLFPEEVQPPPPSMFMFMRKEVSWLIPAFNYDRIRFRMEEAIPPDDEDRLFVEEIRKLDDLIRLESGYEIVEPLAISVEEEGERLFRKWLAAKGFAGNPDEYATCLGIYIMFLYRYQHADHLSLGNVPAIYLIEFFEDFLLRKVICKPSEYIYWPPALKLFYQFLHEKGYLSTRATSLLLGGLDSMEEHFLEILRERFS